MAKSGLYRVIYYTIYRPSDRYKRFDRLSPWVLDVGIVVNGTEKGRATVAYLSLKQNITLLCVRVRSRTTGMEGRRSLIGNCNIGSTKKVVESFYSALAKIILAFSADTIENIH